VDEEHRGGTLDFRLAFVCADEPQGFPDTLPPIAAATADIAEVRLHGRNSQSWAMRAASPRRCAMPMITARTSLPNGVPRIRTLHSGARPVHVLLNNCWRGFAARNAQTLASQHGVTQAAVAVAWVTRWPGALERSSAPHDPGQIGWLPAAWLRLTHHDPR
jgi:uncharacterized protein YecE (DUF72 family)